jgi:peptidoglycan/LPS O-acetylase OafA/YrhL
MVFFVLSGFVISYVSDKKEKTLKDYFCSRFARLYSVAIPAVVLTIALDSIGSSINYTLYDGWWFQNDRPIWRTVANLLFVQELWFSSTRLFSNGPFWSLGYEFWYYVIFAAAWYLKGRLRYLLVAAICLLIGPKILLLFPVWLFGVLVYFKTKSNPVSEPVGWTMFLGSAAAYIIFRHGGYSHQLHDWTVGVLGNAFVQHRLMWSKDFLSSYFVGAMIALHFVGAVSVLHRTRAFLEYFEQPVRYLGGYTFAIYLFHYPLLQFFSAVSSQAHLWEFRRTIVIIGTIGIIWILGAITERRKADVKLWLLSMYDTGARLSSKYGDNFGKR